MRTGLALAARPIAPSMSRRSGGYCRRTGLGSLTRLLGRLDQSARAIRPKAARPPPPSGCQAAVLQPRLRPRSAGFTPGAPPEDPPLLTVPPVAPPAAPPAPATAPSS